MKYVRVDYQALLRGIQAPAKIMLVRIGVKVEREAKRLVSTSARPMRGPRGGRKYASPSTPGEPPHVRLGALRASIGHALVQEGPLPSAIAGPTEKYGKWLEYGTRKMAARPFMRPALFNVAGK